MNQQCENRAQNDCAGISKSWELKPLAARSIGNRGVLREPCLEQSAWPRGRRKQRVQTAAVGVNKITNRLFDFPFADPARPALRKMRRSLSGLGRRQFSIGRQQELLIG